MNIVEASSEQHLMHVQMVMDKHRDGNHLGNNAVEMKGRLYSVNLNQSGLDFLYNTE